MLTFYGAGKKAAHAAKTVKHGVSEQCSLGLNMTVKSCHWVIPEKIHTPPTDGKVF